MPFNSLPNDKFFDWSELKAFVDVKKLQKTKMTNFVFEGVGNIVGKKNAGFSFFHNVFKRLLTQGRKKAG